MPTPSPSRAKDLMILAGRMGIPVDEAVRQVAQVIADVQPPVVVPAEPRDVAVPAELAVPAEPREAESRAVA